jgi:hypothetical protein
MDHRDFKETVTRPFHIQNKAPTDEYRDGWDRIWGKRKVQVLPPDKAPPSVEPSKE